MSAEKIVYFVRHGQSEANAASVFQGPDSPLTEKGRQQAERIAERAVKLSFEALIASPILRVKETTKAIEKATNKKAEYSELFVERVRPTSVHDKPHSDAAADATWRAWEESLFTSGKRVEDGENFDDLVVRADRALEFLKERPEQSLMVVTHGFFLRTMVARVLLGDLLTGKAFKSFQTATATENTGLTILKYKAWSLEAPRWRLWIYNDHAHLG